MLDFTRLDKVRRQRPLIHCVSNIVTANDCANLALAVGASPMMAPGTGRDGSHLRRQRRHGAEHRAPRMRRNSGPAGSAPSPPVIRWC